MRARKLRSQCGHGKGALGSLESKRPLCAYGASPAFGEFGHVHEQPLLFYLGSPGISVLGNLFPGFRSNVASIQSNFERILVTLFWSTTGALAMTQFSKEYSLRQAIVRQAIVRHTSYMTNPPQLCLH